MMLGSLGPLMWCSWGEGAGRRPEEDLADGPAKELVANGGESVERPTAKVTLYESPGGWHVEHIS